MENENNLAIALLTRTRLEIFDLEQKKVFPFNLQANLFQDLEVINKNELETQMSLFINFYKIKPVPLLIILSSDICFEQEIADVNDSVIESKVSNFLNYLPFEESEHKIYRLAKGFYISAVNKELIDVFKMIFKKLGFTVGAIVPSSIAGINIKTIDIPAADFILAKLNTIKSQSLVAPEARFHENQTEPKKVMGVNRVFILLGLFLVLLLVLLLVLYQQTLNNQTLKNKKAFEIKFSQNSG